MCAAEGYPRTGRPCCGSTPSSMEASTSARPRSYSRILSARLSPSSASTFWRTKRSNSSRNPGATMSGSCPAALAPDQVLEHLFVDPAGAQTLLAQREGVGHVPTKLADVHPEQASIIRVIDFVHSVHPRQAFCWTKPCLTAVAGSQQRPEEPNTGQLRQRPGESNLQVVASLAPGHAGRQRHGISAYICVRCSQSSEAPFGAN